MPTPPVKGRSPLLIPLLLLLPALVGVVAFRRVALAHAIVSLTSAAQPAASSSLENADRLLTQRRLPEAERAYRALLVLEPASAHALEGLGLALGAQDRKAEAFDALERATDLDPYLPRAQAQLGAWYLEGSFKREAARRLTLAVTHAPRDADAWHSLGLALAGLEQNTEAEAAYRHCVNLMPNRSGFQLDLADLLATNNKAADAEAAYRRAVALAPHDADALSRLGGFLLDRRHDPAGHSEADRVLQAALQKDPSNDFALYQSGRLALERGEARRSAIALGRAVALAPQVSEDWYALARAYTRLGDAPRAHFALENFHRLHADYEARTHTSELLDLHPKQYALHRTLARLYAKAGENAKAIFEYEAYLHLVPGDNPTRDELKKLEAHLKAIGHLPQMALFRAMVDGAVKHKGEG